MPHVIMLINILSLGNSSNRNIPFLISFNQHCLLLRIEVVGECMLENIHRRQDINVTVGLH